MHILIAGDFKTAWLKRWGRLQRWIAFRSIGRTTLTTLLFVLLSLVACEPATPTPQPKTYPYQIVTTVGMITDIVRQVAGRHAVVDGIMKEGDRPPSV